MDSEDVAATAVQQELADTEEEPSVPVAAQQQQPTSARLLGGASGRSRSAPPILRTQYPTLARPANDSPVSHGSNSGSSSGSSSDWISNATDVSLDGLEARGYNGLSHNDGGDCENGTSHSVPSNSTFEPDTVSADSQIQLSPSISTNSVSGQEQSHGSNSGSASGSGKDSSITTSSSSMSIHYSASNSSDPTKSNTSDKQSSSILDTDDEDVDDAASLESLMTLVDAYSQYFSAVEAKQTEEYIISVLKSYVDLAFTSRADLRIISEKVFDDCDAVAARPTGSDNNSADEYWMSEEATTSELCASLERRLQAVRDYTSSTCAATTEQAIREMIIKEYNEEMRRAEIDIPELPAEGASGNNAAAATGIDVLVEGSAMPDKDGGSASQRDDPLEGLPATGRDSLSQAAAGSAKEEGAQEISSECVVPTKQTEAASESSSSCSSAIALQEYALSAHYEQIYPETERQKKIRKSRQSAAVLKIFTLAQARVCGIRNMNWVMLNCLKMVLPAVRQALEVNGVARRALAEARALPTAAGSGDLVAAMTETATAAMQCAETAVREIEEAVQLHKIIVEALKLAERALYNVKTETCDGTDLIRHLVAGVELIELQVGRACKTYLDKTKGKDSSDSSSALVLPTSSGIRGPVMAMAFENIDDGPSDVFQALLWASQSSVNAMEMVLKGLQDFSIAKLTCPHRFG